MSQDWLVLLEPLKITTLPDDKFGRLLERGSNPRGILKPLALPGWIAAFVCFMFCVVWFAGVGALCWVLGQKIGED